MFIKFDCGCIGFGAPKMTHWNPHRAEDEGGALIYRCDTAGSAEETFLLSHRDMSGKSHLPLDDDEAKEILRELERLIHDGYQLRKIKFLLR